LTWSLLMACKPILDHFNQILDVFENVKVIPIKLILA